MSGTQSKENYYIEVGAWEIVRENGQPKVVLYPGKSLAELRVNPQPKKRPSGRAILMRALLDAGVVRNRAELAQRFGVSRARVTQILGTKQRGGGR